MREWTWNEALTEQPEDAAAPGTIRGMVVRRRRLPDSGEMDITPMIDVTFLLLIFFLVTSTVPDPSKAINLPPARHGAAVNPRTSVIITVAERGAPASGSPGPALVYLGDGKATAPLPDDPANQDTRITRAVREGFAEGRSTVLIKAERGVKHREVSRVATAAAEVEGIQLHLAVLEVQ